MSHNKHKKPFIAVEMKSGPKVTTDFYLSEDHIQAKRNQNMMPNLGKKRAKYDNEIGKLPVEQKKVRNLRDLEEEY